MNADLRQLVRRQGVDCVQPRREGQAMRLSALGGVVVLGGFPQVMATQAAIGGRSGGQPCLTRKPRGGREGWGPGRSAASVIRG